jgi:hypothetical protein
MFPRAATRVMPVLMCVICAGVLSSWHAVRAAAQERLPGNLFDTGSASRFSPTDEHFWAESQWTRVPADRTEHAFQGDAVMCNGRLAIVLRQGEPGARVYSRGVGRPTLRAVLAPASDAPAVRLRTAEIVEEIRRRTQAVLRNPASYEAPRH